MWIAFVVAAITTALGVVTAFALVRFEFPGKQVFGTLVILPALVPETILGVAIPRIELWPFEAAGPAKLRRALEHLGPGR